MNEELQSILASLLERSMEVAEKTGQWVLDIAPELIEQYLMWEFYSALFFVLLSIPFIFAGAYAVRFLINEYKKENEDNWFKEKRSWGWDTKETIIPFSAFIGVSLISGFTMLFVNIYTIVFIKVAPEIYLIKNLL